jgi:hypothetical protein
MAGQPIAANGLREKSLSWHVGALPDKPGLLAQAGGQRSRAPESAVDTSLRTETGQKPAAASDARMGETFQPVTTGFIRSCKDQ